MKNTKTKIIWKKKETVNSCVFLGSILQVGQKAQESKNQQDPRFFDTIQ